MYLCRQNIFYRDISEALNLGKSPVYTLQLSQKSNFQPSTTKPDNIGHPTVKTGQIWPEVVFHFVRIKNIQFYTKKFISNSFEIKKNMK